MVDQRIVVIGASAGGIEACRDLLKNFHEGFAAPVLLVIHIPPTEKSNLPLVLSRMTDLTVKNPTSGETLVPGTIYVAPPNQHMVVTDHQIRLDIGPRENQMRPAIDPLFRSAAKEFGNGAIGVILSGTLSDGTAGSQAIKQAGGVVIVQDPSETFFSGMSTSAIEHVDVDFILSAREIAGQLNRLVGELRTEKGKPMGGGRKNQKQDPDDLIAKDLLGFENETINTPRTVLTCPDCGGILWEVKEGELFEYRCHVGHKYTLESLISGQDHFLEDALWTAIRALTEKAALSARLAKQSKRRSMPQSEAYYLRQVRDAQKNIEVIRKVLTLEFNMGQNEGNDNRPFLSSTQSSPGEKSIDERLDEEQDG